MRITILMILFLILATPSLGYQVLWDVENTSNQMGYLYTQFQSFTEDAEYWAPQHSAGADLDGDGTIEFVNFMGSGANIDAYVVNSMTGSIEFTYTIPMLANERVQVVVYFDGQAGDGFSEVLVQTLYRTFVISGSSTAAAPEQTPSVGSSLLFQPSIPNPFNGSATLRFQLADAGAARVDIFDASGRLVRSVFEGRLPAGGHAVAWDGRNERGVEVASGIYYAKLEAGIEMQTQKIVLAR